MPYARLDVFWPNGDLQTFLLSSDRVTVGRSKNNTIQLDTDTLAEQHFLITRTGRRIDIHAFESEHGTFVDGVKLNLNEPVRLMGVEEINVGHLRVIYRPYDASPTVPMAPERDETQEVHVPDLPFFVNIDKAYISVWPASSNSTELTVTNTSDEDLQLIVKVKGIPDSWVRINRPVLYVEAQSSAYVLIDIKPTRQPDVVAKEYLTTVEVSSRYQPNEQLDVPITVLVNSYKGFGIALGKTLILDGSTTTLFVHNQGNDSVTVQLNGRSPEHDLDVQLGNSVLQLPAGQRAKLRVLVQPRRKIWFGGDYLARFWVEAQLQDSAHSLASLEAKYRIRPVFPKWSLFMGLGIGLGLVALLVFLLFSLLIPRPDPTIESFTALPSPVAQGDFLNLTWSGQNVDQYRLRVNGIEVAKLEDDTRQYALNTSAYHGDIVLVLEAVNGDKIVRAETSALVYQAAKILSFSVEPAILIRNVVSSLKISWDAPGADYIVMDGLDAFTSSALPPQLKETDSLSFNGVAADAFTVTLYIEDELDNSFVENRQITVQDATCVALENLELKEGPSAAYQTVGSINAGKTIVVNAQYQAGKWLRTQLSGVVQAWLPADAMECDAAFKTQNLVPVMDKDLIPTPQTDFIATPQDFSSQSISPGVAAPSQSTPHPTLMPSFTPTATINPAG
ncbi:hypothetical protein MASR2M15_24750 [Anaerolineales bacterium]